MTHDVCFKNKTTSATCPSTVEPMGETKAKFFNQIVTVTITDANKHAFDNVQFDQEVTVNGECNDAAKKAKCQSS